MVDSEEVVAVKDLATRVTEGVVARVRVVTMVAAATVVAVTARVDWEKAGAAVRDVVMTVVAHLAEAAKDTEASTSVPAVA